MLFCFVKKYLSPVFLEARLMFELEPRRASNTPDTEEDADDAGSESDPRAVMMMVTMMERRSTLKLILPRVIMRTEVIIHFYWKYKFDLTDKVFIRQV